MKLGYIEAALREKLITNEEYFKIKKNFLKIYYLKKNTLKSIIKQVRLWQKKL